MGRLDTRCGRYRMRQFATAVVLTLAAFTCVPEATAQEVVRGPGPRLVKATRDGEKVGRGVSMEPRDVQVVKGRYTLSGDAYVHFPKNGYYAWHVILHPRDPSSDVQLDGLPKGVSPAIFVREAAKPDFYQAWDQ